jgi:hypothetical protein
MFSLGEKVKNTNGTALGNILGMPAYRIHRKPFDSHPQGRREVEHARDGSISLTISEKWVRSKDGRI